VIAFWVRQIIKQVGKRYVTRATADLTLNKGLHITCNFDLDIIWHIHVPCSMTVPVALHKISAAVIEMNLLLQATMYN
jgi:uncharacterized membrane protein (DUF2068 family)